MAYITESVRQEKEKKERLRKELIRRFLIVEKKLGRIPDSAKLEQQGLPKIIYYNRYFGSWKKFLQHIGRVTVRKYARKINPKRFFYPQEWLRFVNAVNNQDHKFWFEVYLHTGARYKELRSLQIKEIDFNRGSLLIKNPKASLGKKNRQRDIEISSYLKNRLLNYIKTNNLGKLDTLGIPRVQFLDRALKTYCSAAGIDDSANFSMHNLRKTFETWCAAGLNINPLLLSAHLGHTVDIAGMFYVSSSMLKGDEKVMIRTILDDLFNKRDTTMPGPQLSNDFGVQQFGRPTL